MNIVTSVRVYPQEGTVETISKLHLSQPLKAPQILSDGQSPFELKGIKR